MDAAQKLIDVIDEHNSGYESDSDDFRYSLARLQHEFSEAVEEEKMLSDMINFNLPISDKLIAKMGLQVIPTPISKEQLQIMEDKNEAERIAECYKKSALMVMICQLTEGDIPEVDLTGIEIILMAEILKKTDHGTSFVKAVENSFGKLTALGGNTKDIMNLLKSYLIGME
jgi:hypothetical protein